MISLAKVLTTCFNKSKFELNHALNKMKMKILNVWKDSSMNNHIYLAGAYNVSVNLCFSYFIVSFFLSDILFGIPWKNSGIARYFIRNQQRTISFAITIAMKTYDQR